MKLSQIDLNIQDIQSIQKARMNHAYCVGLNLGCKKMRFQLVLNKTCKATPKNKTMLSAPSLSPHQFSTQSLQYENWNANKYSILTVNELGLLVLES